MVVMCVIDRSLAPTRSDPGRRETSNRLGGLEDKWYCISDRGT